MIGSPNRRTEEEEEEPRSPGQAPLDLVPTSDPSHPVCAERTCPSCWAGPRVGRSCFWAGRGWPERRRPPRRPADAHWVAPAEADGSPPGPATGMSALQSGRYTDMRVNIQAELYAGEEYTSNSLAMSLARVVIPHYIRYIPRYNAGLYRIVL